MKKYAIATLGAAVLALSACSGTGNKTASSSGSAGDAGTSGSSTSGSGSSSASGSGSGGTSTAPSDRVVYFDLDRADLKPADRAVVEAWAKYLSANSSAKVRLEGHCDERGSREYNVSLGERRGNAVLAALTGQGVASRQLSVTSLGEERPIDLGHSESAWSQNRRVEFIP